LTSDEGVCVSTIHKAKGLEAHVVFVFMGIWKESEQKEEQEEQRRLLFVAMSRARDLLILSYWGGNPPTFVKELQQGNDSISILKESICNSEKVSEPSDLLLLVML
jgi:DNA helicase-2/ATP-dependent DNA helicase PcrA